jgi:hypothetical protein
LYGELTSADDDAVAIFESDGPRSDLLVDQNPVGASEVFYEQRVSRHEEARMTPRNQHVVDYEVAGTTPTNHELAAWQQDLVFFVTQHEEARLHLR